MWFNYLSYKICSFIAKLYNIFFSRRQLVLQFLQTLVFELCFSHLFFQVNRFLSKFDFQLITTFNLQWSDSCSDP